MVEKNKQWERKLTYFMWGKDLSAGGERDIEREEIVQKDRPLRKIGVPFLEDRCQAERHRRLLQEMSLERRLQSTQKL